MKNNYIGKTTYGELVFQTIKEGTIASFQTFSVMELVDGQLVLSESSHCHSVTLDSGIELKSGESPALIIEMDTDHADLYTCDTVSCEVCYAVHDSDDCSGYSSNPTWTIVNECEVVCLGCRSVEQALTLVSSPADLFKAKNLEGIDLNGFEEVDTLFCDASGMGSESERALTKSQARVRTAELIEEHGEIYAGITGIGQFQVYVSIYKKSA
jgi:hypothetical protein